MTDYRDFADHPRYGKAPRVTGLNPRHSDDGVYLHWHSPEDCRIPNTAIKADTSRQVPATVAVTHYFDVVRRCRDCQTSFLFFAVEQKFWYEELGFPLEADCVRCAACRKRKQGLQHAVRRYEALHRISSPEPLELLELADCAIELIEHEVFSRQALEKARSIVNRVERSLPRTTSPTDRSATGERINTLRGRMDSLTKKAADG